MRSAHAAQVFHFHELSPTHIIGGRVRGKMPAVVFSRIALRRAVSCILTWPASTGQFPIRTPTVRTKAVIVAYATASPFKTNKGAFYSHNHHGIGVSLHEFFKTKAARGGLIRHDDEVNCLFPPTRSTI